MLRGYSFRPRVWGLAAAAFACAIFVALGHWQSRRATEKRDLAAAFERALSSAPVELPPGPVDAAKLVRQHVAARGEFLAERTLLLDNKLRRGRAGYEVVTPLRIGTSRWHVLVNRGWIATGASRDTLPEVRTPGGEVRIDGMALERIPHALALQPPSGKVRQNIDIAAFAAETGLQLQPIVIEQRSDSPDGLLRDWPRPDLGIEKHKSYSLQWYSFAALAVVLGIVLSFRRISDHGPQG